MDFITLKAEYISRMNHARNSGILGGVFEPFFVWKIRGTLPTLEQIRAMSLQCRQLLSLGGISGTLTADLEHMATELDRIHGYITR